MLVYGIASPVAAGSVLVMAVAGAIWSRRVPFTRWAAAVTVIALPMLFVVGTVQGLFYPGEAHVLWTFGPARLTAEGLQVAAQIWLRVAAMVAVCLLFALSTDESRVFDALLRLRLPLSLAYVCSSAMGLLPMLRRRLGAGLDAKRARGHPVSRLSVRLRLLPSLIGGVLLSALAELDQRHDALVQRGFAPAVRPSEFRRLPDSRLQQAIRWSAPAASLLLVLGLMLAGGAR